MGFILEIICTYRDADAVSPHTVRTYAGGNTVCQRQQDAVCLFFGSHIPGERCGVAVPLGLSRFGKYWCLVNAVCVCMQLLAQFFSNQSLHKGNICMCQAADGENPTFLQPLCRGAPDGKKRPDRQRPELLGDFLQKQGVDFVRLFKVTCHFGQKLVGTNADVNRKAQRITDFIFDSAGDGPRIRIQLSGTAHIQKAFINGKFFNYRCIFAADIHKSSGVLFIQTKVRFGKIKLRTFAQRQGNRFSCLHLIFFCGNRLGQNHTGACLPVAANGRRD